MKVLRLGFELITLIVFAAVTFGVLKLRKDQPRTGVEILLVGVAPMAIVLIIVALPRLQSKVGHTRSGLFRAGFLAFGAIALLSILTLSIVSVRVIADFPQTLFPDLRPGWGLASVALAAWSGSQLAFALLGGLLNRRFRIRLNRRQPANPTISPGRETDLRPRRLSIMGLMAIVLYVAFNCVIARALYDSSGGFGEIVLLGVFPMANLLIAPLLIKLWCHARSGVGPFLAGFSTFGAIALFAFTVISARFPLEMVSLLQRSFPYLEPGPGLASAALVSFTGAELTIALIGGWLGRRFLVIREEPETFEFCPS